MSSHSRTLSRSGTRALTPLSREGSLPSFGPTQQEHYNKAKEQSSKGGKAPPKKKLGMFMGVLVPTCENMWGVIIFLRFYKIVGYGGLGYALLIVVLSFLVALLTSLSLSAIATCGTSHSLAGVYPMLSRALGKEIATATGIIYFLGIVFLAVLECLGACEELFAINPCLNSSEHSVRIWGSIFMAALVALVAGGIKLVSHLGLVFFLIVIVTMLSFYVSLFGAPTLEALDAGPHSMECVTDAGVTIGGELVTNGSSGSDGSDGSHGSVGPISVTGLSVETIRANWGPAFTETMGFSQCLALFFPCFTGILSGANRASSLRDPVTALPYGTLGAITISLVMYSSYIVLWGAVGDRAFLTMDHGQLNYIIWPHIGAAQVGIIVSSLGQALQVRTSAQFSPQFCAIFSRPVLTSLQCLVVAPRLLASIASDGLLRVLTPVSRLTAGEPKLALLVTYIVGGSCVLIGSLDAVAPLLSMCFLMCYACMNLNCFVLDILKDPHWRPKWRWYHWSVGLAGFLLCTSLMFIIDWLYAIIAWVMTIGVGMLTIYTNAQTDWGSVRALRPPPPLHLHSTSTPPPLRSPLHLLLSRRSTASASSSPSASCWRSTSPSTSTPTGSRSCCCCTSCARSSSTTPRRPTRRRAAGRRGRARKARSSPATPTTSCSRWRTSCATARGS